MEDAFKYWWFILLRGIIFIALGLFVFANPVSALVGLVLYIGIALLVTGVFEIAAALSLRKVNDHWGWNLAGGIIDVLFASILLANPAVTAAVIPFVVGFWVMISGVIIFVNSIRAKKSGLPTWGVGLIGGILTVIAGYLITTNLLVGAFTITVWMGIGFLIAGIVNVFLSLRLKKLKTISIETEG